MALSDLWTLDQLTTAVRRELMDPTGGFDWSWTTVELQYYLNDWQTILQDKFEFTWGSATITLTSNTQTNAAGEPVGPYTIPLTSISTNMLRPGNLWFQNFRLVGRTMEELEVMQRDWREVGGGVPEVAYMQDINNIGFWPPPSVSGTLIAEFPTTLGMAAGTSTMQVPAWTRYSFLDYACWRAWERPGPNQNLTKAQRRKKRLMQKMIRYKTIWENYLPDKAPSFRIGPGEYEGDILNVGRHNTIFQTWF